MTYTEIDPLPSTLGSEFRREYATQATVAGRFGLGWNSIFDAGIVPINLTASKLQVINEDQSHVTFGMQEGGGWKQLWPADAAAGTLTGSEATGYTFRDAGESIVRTFDAAHHLTRIQDLRRNVAVSIVYDANGATRIYDEGGRWSATVTTTDGRITQIVVDGRPDLTWTYGYTGSLLTSVSVAGNATPWRQYEYVSNLLARVLDSTGAVIESHDYDALGRATTAYDGSGGDIINISYGATDANGMATSTVTRSDNTQATYQLDFAGGRVVSKHVDNGCSSCGLTNANAAYDKYGNITRLQSGRGYVTESTYDSTGRQLVRVVTAQRPSNCDPATDPARCQLSPTALAAATLVHTVASQTTTYTYGDANWPGRATMITRDSVVSGRTTTESFTYDAATGEVLVHTETGAIDTAGTLESHTTTTTLYANGEGAAFAPGGAFQTSWLTLQQPIGRKKSVDGPRTDVSDTTTYVYYPDDASVPGTWRGNLAAVRNGLGQITRDEEYNTFGHATAVVDANGVVTRTTYDTLGRILTSTTKAVPGCNTSMDPLCATDLVTTSTYAGNNGPLQTVQRPSGNLTTYTYDTRGRVLTTTRGTASTGLERTTYAYDLTTGKKNSETLSAFEDGAWITKKTETYTYTSDGNLSSTIHADSTAIHYNYFPDGTLSSVQDENHTTPNTTYTYDPETRIATVTQTLASAPGGQIMTRYNYDVAGNLTSVTDPNGNITRYWYDDFHRLQQQVSPVSGTTTYTYDLAGNLRTTTDANGAATTRTYDALNRVTSETATRSSTSETVTWTYDSTTADAFGIGRMGTMTDPSGTTSYAYERRGLLRSEVKAINDIPYSTSYAYDQDGNRSKITYPSGIVAQYTFDYADRPYSLTASGTTIVSTATYLPFGPLMSLSLGNGTTRTMQYDARYRPTENKLTGPGGTIADYTYLEDNVGNITQIRDALNVAYNRDFGYDDINRLTTANSGSLLWGSGSYTYDGMGNLTAATLGTWKTLTNTLSGTTPKLTSVLENGASRSVNYDAAGNETTVGLSTFIYSPRNKLSAQGATTFTYDGRGMLTIASAPSFSVLVPATIKGGSTGTGTLTLTAAQTVDTIVNLSSDNSAATVPASVTVPAGSTSADFPITSTPVVNDTQVTISAQGGGAASLTVLAARLASISVNPTRAYAGDPVTATVTLDGPAAVATTVSISDTIVGSPVTASIAAGATNGSTTITGLRLANRWPEERSIMASLNGATVQTSLWVWPPVLASLSFNPTTTIGGAQSTAQATLTGTPDFAPQAGMWASATSSNPSVAGLYGSIFFDNASISGSGTVVSAPVTSSSTVLITATTPIAGINGPVYQSTNLTVQPVSITIAAFTVSPTTIVGGNPVTGTITLTTAAPAGGIDVDISSSGTAARPRPGYLHINEGSTTGSLTFDTSAVNSNVMLTLSATHSATTISATLQVTAPTGNYVSALQAQSGTPVPNGVATTGGTPITAAATVYLAASGKTSVTLSSSNTAVATVPSSVKVSNGATSATFTITTLSVTSPASAVITASFGGVNQTLTVTVLPVNAVTIASITGLLSSITPRIYAAVVTLTGPAPSGGALITLAGMRTNILAFPSSLTIPAGATSASFLVDARPFLGPLHTSDVTTTYQGITQAYRVTVQSITVSRDQLRPEPIRCASLALPPCLTAAGLHPVTVALGDPSRYYLYAPELQLLAETERSTSTTKPIEFSYLWFGSEPVAQIDSTNTIRWYATDHLGTPFLQTDSTGSIVWRAELAPYDETYAYRAGSTLHQPLRLPGQMIVEASDLHYNIFRWYRGAWGRYTQVDPDRDTARFRPYEYAQSNPIRWSDPLGLAVNVRCRPVAHPVANALGLNHCYLEVVCPKTGIPTTTVSYLGSRVGVEVVENYSRANNDVRASQSGNFDQYPATPGCKNCNCDFEKCVVDLAKALDASGWVITNYSKIGPNSNSFAHRLVLQCGGRVTQHPAKAYGWDTPWNVQLP